MKQVFAFMQGNRMDRANEKSARETGMRKRTLVIRAA